MSRGRFLRSFWSPVPGTQDNAAKLLAALTLALILRCGGGPALAEPGVGARSWVLADAESGEYLAGEDVAERLPMGSTDKIMVALVALRMVESGEVGIEDGVILSEEAAAFATPLYSPGLYSPE